MAFQFLASCGFATPADFESIARHTGFVLDE
jgi:hypothetical protein